MSGRVLAGRGGDVRAGVAAALRSDLLNYRTNGVPAPPVLAERLDAVEAGQRAVVLGRFVPRELWPDPSQDPGLGVVTADDRVVWLGELCGRGILEWLGLLDDTDELLERKRGPGTVLREHGRCCGLDPVVCGG